MPKFFALFSFFLLFSTVHAMCPKALKTREPSSLRLLFDNGVELDFVFGKLEKNRLTESYMSIGPVDVSDDLNDARIRYHTHYVFQLANVEMTKDRRRIFFSDPYNTLNVEVVLRDPFYFGPIHLQRIHIESANTWLNENLPATIEPRNFKILKAVTQQELAYSSKGQMAKELFDILPEESRIAAPDAEEKIRIASMAPYARKNMNLVVKQYRGLIVFRVGIGKSALYQAFTVNRTPVELYDLVSGLKTLNLIKHHPLFARAAKIVYK